MIRNGWDMLRVVYKMYMKHEVRKSSTLIAADEQRVSQPAVLLHQPCRASRNLGEGAEDEIQEN